MLGLLENQLRRKMLIVLITFLTLSNVQCGHVTHRASHRPSPPPYPYFQFEVIHHDGKQLVCQESEPVAQLYEYLAYCKRYLK